MKEIIIENGIEYVRHGNYFIPNLAIPDDKVYNISKYGRLHAKFIKENYRAIYSIKMINGTWLSYLEEIDKRSREMLDTLIKEMSKKQGITEELKAKDQMAWVGAMNNIRYIADEIVFSSILILVATS